MPEACRQTTGAERAAEVQIERQTEVNAAQVPDLDFSGFVKLEKKRVGSRP
jgi:hypothetical protein